MSRIQISGFYDEVSSALDVQIATLKQLGESFLCPRSIDGRSIADYSAAEFAAGIKPRLDAAGIRFSSIGSPIGKTGIDDEEGFAKQKAQLAELVKIAVMMNCKYIRVFSFYYGDREPDSCFDKVLSRTKELLALAKGSGVLLMHENEKKIYGDRPERVLKLYHAVNDPGFVLCFDASNYVQCDVDPAAAFDMLKDYTVYYHIKDCSAYKVEVPLGTGEGRYDYIIPELKKRGYSGFMTLEPHTFKYALMKPLICFIPFVGFFKKDYFRAFRLIDKKMGRGYFTTSSRKDVFIWQYRKLKEMLGGY